MNNTLLQKNNIGYVASLDGLRAVAVILVMMLHANFKLGWSGGLGVSVFFALSGFLITTLLLEEFSNSGTISFKGFYIRRTMRLFPPLYLMLLMVLAYALLFRSGTEQKLIVHDVMSSAAYVYNICWAWGWGIKELLLYHTWSLGVEEQFYLLWPAILYAFLKCKQLNLLKYLLAVFIALVWMLKSMHLFPGLASSIIKEAIFIGCLGALVRFTATKENIINGFTATILLFIILVLGIAPLKFTTQYNTVFNLVSIFSILIILYLVESRNGLLNNLLSNRTIVFLGKISYSLYLWHLPVFRLFYYHSSLPPFISFAAKFIVSFILAIASWYLIEQRATALGRKWSKKVAAIS